MIEAIQHNRREEAKDKLINAAYIAWQINGASNEKSFNQYLQILGLVEKQEIKPGQLEEEKEKGISKAQKIIEMDKARQMKGAG